MKQESDIQERKNNTRRETKFWTAYLIDPTCRDHPPVTQKHLGQESSGLSIFGIAYQIHSFFVLCPKQVFEINMGDGLRVSPPCTSMARGTLLFSASLVLR